MTTPLQALVERVRAFLKSIPTPPNAITWEHGCEILDNLQERTADIAALADVASRALNKDALVQHAGYFVNSQFGGDATVQEIAAIIADFIATGRTCEGDDETQRLLDHPQ